MLEPEVETRPWDEQLELDDEAFRAQLVYLRERSPFYREKLAGAPDVGLAEIAQLPLTDKSELKATATAENPFGSHFAADPAEIVRIYSTSGTTGTPSYLPLTAGDLENWVTGSARSYAASGVVRRAADRLDLQRRPVRRRGGARRLRAHRPLPCPRRDREHRAPAARRSSCSGPRLSC